ncbi:Protein FAR1-RELATED SEQUENCE 12, partial [Ananas comosus]
MEDFSVIGSTSSLTSLPNADASIDEFTIVEIEELEEDIPSEQVYETEETDSEPYIGQEFSSLEEAGNFYNKYAFKTRFSIRKSTHYKAKKQDNMITSVTYTCSKEARFFRSHRTITKEQKELIHMLSEQNITPSQIMAFLETRDGGRKMQY